MKNPIGIFDSGIGGLTVASAIHKLLPQEELLYFGDTAHMPYGDKSRETIIKYSTRIAQYLINNGAKMLVIACNSASAHAFETIQATYGHLLPIINVIDPVVDIVNQSNYTKVGVIGTKATIQSQLFPNKINQMQPNTKVQAVATPLLAPMIEEGFFNNNISRTVVHSYLNHYKLKGIKAIILACTHYPLIIKEIDAYYKGKVTILNTADIVAAYVSKHLYSNNLSNKSDAKPVHQFCVSDITPGFQITAKMFFGDSISLKLVSID